MDLYCAICICRLALLQLFSKRSFNFEYHYKCDLPSTARSPLQTPVLMNIVQCSQHGGHTYHLFLNVV